MNPFRELMKPKTKFVWTEELQQLFEASKLQLISLCQEGIRSYDIKRHTILQCDWSKDGIGFLLLQKYCKCPLPEAPNCCPTGWHLVYAGSRTTLPAESRYAPIEGESLAVAWSLKKCKSFVLGCENLIVVTDHKPLLHILCDRDLDTIDNPRLQRLKTKTLPFTFSIQHCPGQWHRGQMLFPEILSPHPPLTLTPKTYFFMTWTKDSFS